jgi:hypothetical protein
MNRIALISIAVTIGLFSCKKDPVDTLVPKLIFKFQFDSTMVRLNNIGQPATIPAGNSGQTPAFNLLSAHYIELAPSPMTALGTGTIVYHAPETTAGGANAIDFNKGVPVSNGQTFFSINLKDVAPGTYTWLRVSLAYQNYDIKFKVKNPLDTNQVLAMTGTIASFIGFNTYITNYKIKTQTITVNANKLQGYWGFETTAFGTSYTLTGQAPAGATTVPNPLFATSPIPSGSCVVTAEFASPLTITGNETKDMVVTVKVSINKSFEWHDANADGWYQPDAGDYPVDMGVRGISPSWQ